MTQTIKEKELLEMSNKTEVKIKETRPCCRRLTQCGIRNDGIIVMTGNAVTFVGVIKPLIRAAILTI